MRLAGAPGVESARWRAGRDDVPAEVRLDLRALRERGALDSPARFVCALALVRGGLVLFEARGTIEGRIAPAPRGAGGFGYDPIFFYPPFNATLAEVGARKSEVSHRRTRSASLPHFCPEE